MVEVGGRREARRLLLPALGSRFLLHRNFNPGTTTVDDVFVAVTVIDLRSDVPSKVWVNRPNMGLKAFGDDGNLVLFDNCLHFKTFLNYSSFLTS